MKTELLIYCCALDAIDDELQQAYLPLLDGEEQRRYEGFRVEPARKSFLVSRALARTLLAERFNCAPRDVRFARDHNDKPTVEFPSGRWQFNLTHSGNWVALALSESGAIGVDVEYHERRNQLDGISKRFFSAAEHQYLMGLPDELRRQRFFELWTVKEAYVKALGRGIATALAGTAIEYLDNDKISLALSGAACCEGAVHCWHYPLAPAYSLALATIGDIAPAAPRLFNCIPLRECRENPDLQPSLTGLGRPA